jgi:uncharacterized protein (TIGR03790 family)
LPSALNFSCKPGPITDRPFFLSLPKPVQFALGAGLFASNCLLAFNAAAGGSGLNTVVVINQSSSNSCQAGNYFCERRQVPPDNVLFINWTGGNIVWTNTDFQTNLLNPLLAMLAARQLTNQIDYVVLSMDIPFKTVNGSNVNSTTSALFYGLKSDTDPDAAPATNSYFASEQVFSQATPANAPGYSFLATMLTGNSVAEAEYLVDQGVAADGTFPAQPVVLAKSSDATRNIRFAEFDNAIFDTRLFGNYQIQRTNSDSPSGQTNLLGYETGLASFSISSNTFVPGAMADSVTSYGGVIFGPNNQTNLLAFTGAGAAGSYGTVTEPDANLAKFPNPEAYFYQARGFSLAECYYQSLFVPYEGLIVAEPLAAPCQRPALGQWLGPASNAVLAGTAPLPMRFTANDAGHPLQQIDLFVDGKYFRTLTNLAPSAGNRLNVTLNGTVTSYVVPPAATVATVAAGLAAALNDPGSANETMTTAAAYGDRVELEATATNPVANSFYYRPATTAGPGAHYYQVVYLSGPIPPELTPLGRDPDGVFRMQLETPADVAGVVLASTNLVNWVPVFTNLPGGSMEFADLAATNYPQRFYRAGTSNPQPQLTLSALGPANGGGFALHVGTQTAAPYVIQASADLSQWIPLFTNQPGGGMNFVDAQAMGLSNRFYRAVMLSPAAPPPRVTALLDPASGGPMLQITGAAQPYVIQSSTNLVNWSPVFTNLATGEIQTAVGSSIGSAGVLSTFIAASRNTFLDSQAQGMQSFAIWGSVPIGASLRLNVVKINGETVSLAVTNQSLSGTLGSLASQFVNLVNATPALGGEDGIIAEDLYTNLSLEATFNLYARTPGHAAATAQIQVTGSGNLYVNPPGPTGLNANLSDLQSRNHLYVTAGAASLGLTFPLDTTALPDGFHELAAVAYEGSSVQTQTRITLPVVIQNSSLSANLNLLDLPTNAPVQGTYHLQVTANTSTVGAISLFSTGGTLGTVSNQPSATFTITGTNLGIGLHPFYAIVQTTNGLSYRTQTQWARLVGGP